MSLWKVQKGYLELLAPQRSNQWKRARKVTASNIEAILGLSRFKTKADIIGQILGGPEKSFTLTEQARMDFGTRMEAPLRTFHMTRFCPTATVIEPSLCIGLKWYDIPFRDGKLSDFYPSQLEDPLHPNWWIGGSPDGILTFPDGRTRNLELKFTEKGYAPLLERAKGTDISLSKEAYRYTPCASQLYLSELKELGLNVEAGALDYFPHIWRSHYLQMQTCMFVTRNLECDYGVGSPSSYYTETIPYDERLWISVYRELIHIIEEEIKPRMSSCQLEDFTKEIKQAIQLVPSEMELRVPFITRRSS